MKFWLISDEDTKVIEKALGGTSHEDNDYNCEEWPPGSPCRGCLGQEERDAARDTLQRGLYITEHVPIGFEVKE